MMRWAGGGGGGGACVSATGHIFRWARQSTEKGCIQRLQDASGMPHKVVCSATKLSYD